MSVVIEDGTTLYPTALAPVISSVTHFTLDLLKFHCEKSTKVLILVSAFGTRPKSPALNIV